MTTPIATAAISAAAPPERIAARRGGAAAISSPLCRARAAQLCHHLAHRLNARRRIFHRSARSTRRAAIAALNRAADSARGSRSRAARRRPSSLRMGDGRQAVRRGRRRRRRCRCVPSTAVHWPVRRHICDRAEDDSRARALDVGTRHRDGSPAASASRNPQASRQPLFVNRMFAGLMSRCRIPASCAAARTIRDAGQHLGDLASRDDLCSSRAVCHAVRQPR